MPCKYVKGSTDSFWQRHVDVKTEGWVRNNCKVLPDQLHFRNFNKTGGAPLHIFGFFFVCAELLRFLNLKMRCSCRFQEPNFLALETVFRNKIFYISWWEER